MNLSVEELCKASLHASNQLRIISPKNIDTALRIIAKNLLAQTDRIIDANEDDVAAAHAAGLSAAVIDRLSLDEKRIAGMVEGITVVRSLPNPLGTVIEERTPKNGLHLRKVRVPLGVIGFIYESRPNVTVDAAILSLKSGNAIILRGGKEAIHSNTVLVAIIQEALKESQIPVAAVQLLSDLSHERVAELLTMKQYVNLIIPRGGRSLIDAVSANSKVPVLKHEKGVCHTYVDKNADLTLATKIAFDAKMHRTGVCNAMETLLVHKAIADKYLPLIGEKLQTAGCEVRGDDTTRHILPWAREASEEDWTSEYLDAILSVKVVNSLEEAIRHINTYGSHHTDSIVSTDSKAIDTFFNEVDSAAVLSNASTRLHDGFEFGMGAEIGISTDKFHARGPVGLNELTSYKWLAEGNGQTRG